MAPSIQVGNFIRVIFALTLIDKSFAHSTFRHSTRHHNHHHLIPAELDITGVDSGELAVKEIQDRKKDSSKEFEDDLDKQSELQYKDIFKQQVNKEYRQKYENVLTQNARLREENRRLRNQNYELVSEDIELVQEEQTLMKENDELKEKNNVKNQNLLKEYSILHHEYDELRQEEGELRQHSKRLLGEDKGVFEESKKLLDEEREFHKEKSHLYDESLVLHKKYEKLLSEYDELRKQMIEFHRCCLEPKVQDRFVTEENNTVCKDCSELLRRTELREMLIEDNYELPRSQSISDIDSITQRENRFANADTYSSGATEDSVPQKAHQSEKDLDSIQSQKGKHDLNASGIMIVGEKAAKKKDETMADKELRNITGLHEKGPNMEIHYGDEAFNLVGNFSWEPEDRSKAFDHMVQVTDFATCDKPKPQVFATQDLVSDKRRYYSPQATVLHRCGRHSGCCANEFLSCVPAKKESVELFFFMVRFDGNEMFGPVVEKLHLTNHTKCGCVYKEQAKDYLD